MVALQYAAEAQPTLSNDRRIFGRTSISLRVRGKRLDHTLAARRQPVLDLEVGDISLNGISAITDLPLQSGEHVVVHLPPRSGMPAWDAFGRVTRCEPSREGYRVAVEFEALPAA